MSVVQVLRNVREEVVRLARTVGHEQVPALYDQALGDFYFRPAASVQVTGSKSEAVQAQRPNPSESNARNSSSEAVELAFWDSIKQSNKESDFEAYLEKYPNGQFASVAKSRAGTWISDANGCRVRDFDQKPNTSFTWSGPCVRGKAEGSGTLEKFVNGARIWTAHGRLKEGLAYGPAVATYPDGSRAETQFENGKANGKVVIMAANGVRMEGTVKDDKPVGKFTVQSPDGSRYIGELSKAFKPHGRGVYTDAKGWRYEGEFKDGREHGSGILRFAKGGSYEGDFKDGIPEGRGVLTDSDGSSFAGEIVAGKPHGSGILTSASGERREATFIHGKRVR